MDLFSGYWQAEALRRQPSRTRVAPSRQTYESRRPQLPRRKTDIRRTEDNRPVCYHCGRPGHVYRHCRERQTFQDYNPRQRETIISDEGISPSSQLSSSPQFEERRRSPSPYRRRNRSPSPYRRSNRSPSRRSMEN
ncbi:uncharacterized protein [Parasteatoda tepidariorum]|uniref:uncharacterized protein n=1 Tax=Parasteatoda tepidariorum TaxID=114398 RepID=UPI001C7223A6|nr:serine/arginine-rich splicing factor RSZ22A-like [Parasteatoda tepidariorum]